MSEGNSVTEKLNAFDVVISQLSSVDIKIVEDHKCIILFCYFPNSWDILIAAIGSNNTTLKINNVVASLLSKEMRWKNIQGLTHDALMVRIRLVDRGIEKTPIEDQI